MKILIVGYYGFKNSGDELILSKIIDDIQSILPESEILVWSGDIKYTEEIHKVKAINRFSIEETISTVKNVDLIIVGGGGLIHEYFGIDVKNIFTSFGYNIPSYAIVPLLAKIYEKPVFYWGHGVGPIFSEDAKKFTKWFYKLSDFITVRDEYSYTFLKEMGIKDLILDIDPVTAINIENFIESIHIPLPENKIKVGINLRPWFGDEKTIKYISQYINEIFKKINNLIFIPIPFDLEQDVKILNKFAELLLPDSFVKFDIQNFNTPKKLISFMNQLDVFIGMRFHSILISRLLNIPTIALSYDIKTDLLIKKYNIPSINIEDIDNQYHKFSSYIELILNSEPLPKLHLEYKTPEVFKKFLEDKIEEKIEIKDFMSFINSPEINEKYIKLLKNEIEVLKVENENLIHEKNSLNDQIQSLKVENENLIHEKNSLNDQIQSLKVENENLIHEKNSLIKDKNDLVRQLNKIYESDFWKLAKFYYKVRDKTFIKNIHKALSIWRREGLGELIKKLKGKYQKININSTPIEFNPYKTLQLLKPIDVIVIDKDYSIYNKKKSNLNFSAVIPVKNEEDSILTLLTNLEKQTLKPEEIIIVDGGSKDKTLKFIKGFKKKSSLNIKLIETKLSHISKQRNIGIKEAKNEIVVLIDAGTILTNSLLENLVAPLSEYPDADLIAGIYHPTKKSSWAYKFIWNWETLDFANYIPSAKALVIKKSKALSIGGFPEYLSYAGEDTLFGVNYRKISKKWIINKAAIQFWEAPENKKEALRKTFVYGKGDGENGLGEFRFYENLIKYLKKEKIIINDSIEETFFKGYIEGRKNKMHILQKNNVMVGNVLLLSGVPLTDSGGGQRGTQISLELMKKGYKVTFCNIYPSYEKFEKIFLDVEYPLLELYMLKDFSIEDYIQRHKNVLNDTIILIEFPHPNILPIIKKLKSITKKITIIYDCIDNWDSSLGSDWYSLDTEIDIIKNSDILIASANTLKQRLENISGRQVHLVKNAVNTRLFKPGDYKRPKDLPPTENIVMYVGALWGEWFDWQLVEILAKSIPDYHFIYIGNIPSNKEEHIKTLETLGNIHFLGLKNQADLPSYLNYAKCCIIPFHYDEKIIKYTNPLKVYEYLAMKKPVVSTYMDELVNIPGVLMAKNHEEFVMKLKRALKEPLNTTDLDKFIYLNSWGKKVEEILTLAKKGFN